jgi:hypothetical protein
MTGEYPDRKFEMDHKDRDRSNNRFSNLRLATTSQNQANVGLRKDNISGFKGVSWEKAQNKWRATIAAGGERTVSFSM